MQILQMGLMTLIDLKFNYCTKRKNPCDIGSAISSLEERTHVHGAVDRYGYFSSADITRGSD